MRRGLVWRRHSLRLSLKPGCLAAPAAAVRAQLKAKRGKHDRELDGIVLKYRNIKIINDIGIIRQDDADIYLDVQVQFLLFQPKVGATFKGIINKKNVTHLSVLVYKIFNVVIPRPTDNLNVKWLGDQLEVGQKIYFKIAVLDLYGALPYIRGIIDESTMKESESKKP